MWRECKKCGARRKVNDLAGGKNRKRRERKKPEREKRNVLRIFAKQVKEEREEGGGRWAEDGEL